MSLVDDMREQPAAVAGALDPSRPGLVEARELLAGARSVRFLGLGSSRHAAGFGARALEHMAGIPASVDSAPCGTIRPVPTTSRDVVIAVSQSGATPATIAAATQVAERGTPVITITNGAHSPLERLATVALDCGAGTEHAVAATKSTTAMMAVLRALAAPVAAHVIVRTRVAVGEQLSSTLPIVNVPPAWVVVGGVVGDWVAEEIALKLAEIAGVVAAGKGLADFLHGAIAATAPIALVATDGDANANTVVAKARSDIVRVNVVPTGDAFVDAILAVIAGQQLALAVARSLGRNPDDTRGLMKVTRSA